MNTTPTDQKYHPTASYTHQQTTGGPTDRPTTDGSSNNSDRTTLFPTDDTMYWPTILTKRHFHWQIKHSPADHPTITTARLVYRRNKALAEQQWYWYQYNSVFANVKHTNRPTGLPTDRQSDNSHCTALSSTDKASTDRQYQANGVFADR